MDDQQKIDKAREILGPLAKDLTDSQLKDIVTEIHFLTDTWLDEIEKELFDGHTVQQLLSQEV